MVLAAREYDKICQFFKTTTEPYDYVEWECDVLQVWLGLEVIERYSREDLYELEILTTKS